MKSSREARGNYTDIGCNHKCFFEIHLILRNFQIFKLVLKISKDLLEELCNGAILSADSL